MINSNTNNNSIPTEKSKLIIETGSYLTKVGFIGDGKITINYFFDF